LFVQNGADVFGAQIGCQFRKHALRRNAFPRLIQVVHDDQRAADGGTVEFVLSRLKAAFLHGLHGRSGCVDPCIIS
jgi:hypothetical protein